MAKTLLSNEVMQAADLVVFDGKIIKARHGGTDTPVPIEDGAYKIITMPPREPSTLRGMTITQAQAQSLALTTMGFRDEYELRIEHDPETGVIAFDIYHVRVEIDPYGVWIAFGKESGETLSTGGAPAFYEWDHRRLNP